MEIDITIHTARVFEYKMPAKNVITYNRAVQRINRNYHGVNFS